MGQNSDNKSHSPSEGMRDTVINLVKLAQVEAKYTELLIEVKNLKQENFKLRIRNEQLEKQHNNGFSDTRQVNPRQQQLNQQLKDLHQQQKELQVQHQHQFQQLQQNQHISPTPTMQAQQSLHGVTSTVVEPSGSLPPSHGVQAVAWELTQTFSVHDEPVHGIAVCTYHW